jgi:hypothetical protein
MIILFNRYIILHPTLSQVPIKNPSKAGVSEGDKHSIRKSPKYAIISRFNRYTIRFELTILLIHGFLSSGVFIDHMVFLQRCAGSQSQG